MMATDLNNAEDKQTPVAIEVEATQTQPLPSRTRTAFMFGLAIVFLALAAFILPHGGVSEDFSELSLSLFWVPWLFVGIWFAIILEGLFGVVMTSDRLKPALLRFLLVTVIPPFRATISPQFANTQIWLPRTDWKTLSRSLFDHIELKLALPMLLITLLILPIIAGELFFNNYIKQTPALALLLHTTTAFIWFAFALEFILLVSVAEKKADYCKKHWINIVIILLPVVAFLRTLQIFRFLRLTKAGKLLRAYRLRGLSTRAMRIILMLNLIDRFMQRNPHKYAAHLQEKIQGKEEELAELQEKLQQTQIRINQLKDQ